MNYIKEINAFYNVFLPQNQLSANAQALWHRLMAYCNAFCWKKDFTITNTMLIEQVNFHISDKVKDKASSRKQAFDRARNELAQKGLIIYTKGSSGQCGSYTMLSLIMQENIRDNTGDDTGGDTDYDTGGDTDNDTSNVTVAIPLDKLNKTKQEETKLNETFIKKEINKQKKDNAPKGDEVSALFESFWAAYPKRVSKSNAVKAFAKIKPDDDLLAVMISAVEKQKQSDQWQKDNGQYIPHPATWLNQRRWEDDMTVQQTEKSQEEIYRELGINLFRKGVDDQ